MIDLAQAIESQRDLELLCNGPLEPAPEEREMHNSGYGFAQILKRYAGYPLDKPVEAVIPHGVYMDASRMLGYELEAPVPAVLNYPAFRSRVWEASSDKILVPSASPFLYALSMFRKNFVATPEPEGTLFFTPHRDASMYVVCDYGPLIKALQSLDARYHPVTVCASIVDYRKGDHLPFIEAGFDVVCAGQPEDQEYVYRWLHLLSRHRYAVGTRVGGWLFYSVAAGVSTHVLKFQDTRRWNPAAFVASRPESPQMRDTMQSIAALFSEPSDENSPEAEEVVGYMLGAENFKEPSELLADLEMCERLAAT